MAGPRRLPDGRPAPDTAPDEDILDQQDLRGIADALREGKKVGLSADGKIHVFDNPEGPPIDAASEAFVENHLGEVRSMLQMGFNATIHPSGEITANSADGRFMYQTDETVALTAADRQGIRHMLAGGADVGILPDGTIQYTQNPGLPVRTAREADEILARVDQEIASGRMAEQAAAGRGLLISGNTWRDGVRGNYVDSPDIPGIRLPDPEPAGTTAGDPPATTDPVPTDPAPSDPTTPATPALTDAEEASRLERYADDLDERARLVRQAAEAAARGDEARSNELLDQSRIELVEEPPDLGGDQAAPSADIDITGAADVAVAAVPTEPTEPAADAGDPTATDIGFDPAAESPAEPTAESPTFTEPEPVVAAADTDFGAPGDFADAGSVADVTITDDAGAESLDA